MVEAIPTNYPRVTAYLTVDDGEAAVAFYTKALGGIERMRLPGPDGGIGHAEVAFESGLVMLAEKDPMIGNKSPGDLGGTPVSLVLYVEDVDATIEVALAHGARLVQPVESHFYGDRAGTIQDPVGHVWNIMTHVEDVSPDELQRRMAAMAAEASS